MTDLLLFPQYAVAINAELNEYLIVSKSINLGCGKYQRYLKFTHIAEDRVCLQRILPCDNEICLQLY
jgi:hypothetical protein